MKGYEFLIPRQIVADINLVIDLPKDEISIMVSGWDGPFDYSAIILPKLYLSLQKFVSFVTITKI